ncbi:MAG: PASTA domain-containing protein [Bacteroidetes bacterium]|nr:PASTA domain-containing protein [Bacteroidota bacterium]
MSNFFSFLKSKQFFIHFAIILVALFLSFFCLVKWLRSYTNHGDFVEVPDFKGKQISDLKSFVTNKDVSFQIIDSIYDPKEKPGIVLRQEPEPKSKVKHNRTIYLYVTGMVAPQIQMPKLIDRSERQARLIIQTYGLKVGRVTEKQADCNGCILAQTMKGEDVEPGKSVKKGSVIDLVVGIKDSYFTSNPGDTGTVDEPNFNNVPD